MRSLCRLLLPFLVIPACGGEAEPGFEEVPLPATQADHSLVPPVRSFIGMNECAAAQAGARPGWAPVWCDEFEGDEIDRSKWNFDIGDGGNLPSGPGWGNDELEYYTAKSHNARLTGGELVITADRDGPHYANGVARAYQYSSARLTTKGKGDWVFGRIEMQAKLPRGQGLWPAFWMLPTDSIYGGWAASGEIDIMELRGQEPDRVLGTLHFGEQWNQNKFAGCDYRLQKGSFVDDYHVFAFEWEPTEMRWYIDDRLYATHYPRDKQPRPPKCLAADGTSQAPSGDYLNGWYSSGGDSPAPFNERFHLILNLAVGGRFLGPPDGTTSFPQSMNVKYVRVYQRNP